MKPAQAACEHRGLSPGFKFGKALQFKYSFNAASCNDNVFIVSLL